MRIDGREIARKIFENLKERVEKLKKRKKLPHLAMILVGDDPASKSYIRQKDLWAKDLGIKTTILNLPQNIKEGELLKVIKQLNNDNDIHGIVVQQPLPKNINPVHITKAIEPKKDVDAFHPKTFYSMPLGNAVEKIIRSTHSSTPRVEAQKKFSDWLKTKKIVVIGKGETGGGPVIEKLKNLGVKPLIVDSKTKNPQNLTKKADIIISAVGKPNVIKKRMIKKDVILISVGLHHGNDGRLHGDYEEEEIKDIASFYTPSPGGVGPVNVAMLLDNVVKASEEAIT